MPHISDGVIAWCDGLQTMLTRGGGIGDGGCWGHRCDRSRAAACLQQLAMQLSNREQHIQGHFAHIRQVAAQEAHPKPLNASQVQPTRAVTLAKEALQSVFLILLHPNSIMRQTLHHLFSAAQHLQPGQDTALPWVRTSPTNTGLQAGNGSNAVTS